MKCPLLPVGQYYVVVEDAPPAAYGRILVNAAFATSPRTGSVAAWGPDTTELKIGDRCAWRRGGDTAVAIGDSRFLLLKEEDIVCRLEP